MVLAGQQSRCARRFLPQGRVGVDAQVRVRVARLPHREQPLHLRAIGGERPAAVGRQPRDHRRQRHVEPHRHAVELDRLLVLGIHERAAAGGDHGVAQRQQQAQDLALGRPEVRLAVAREDVGHGGSLARLDQLVDVLGAPAEAFRQHPGDGGLAGGHEPDQVDLVDSGGISGISGVTARARVAGARRRSRDRTPPPRRRRRPARELSRAARRSRTPSPADGRAPHPPHPRTGGPP